MADTFYSLALSPFNVATDLSLISLKPRFAANTWPGFLTMLMAKLAWDVLVGLGINAMVVAYLHRRKSFFRA